MPDRSTTRILIIDDDLEFAGILRLHLTAAGYTAEVAEDAIEGGKAMLEQTPDLVLCDIGMPFLNGLELVSLMQADAKSASIPGDFSFPAAATAASWPRRWNSAPRISDQTDNARPTIADGQSLFAGRRA